jgi:hypothetical protein
MANVTNIRVGDLCRRKYENGTWSQQLFEVRNVVGNKVTAWMYYGEWSREVVLDATDLEPGEKAEWLPYAEWVWNQGRGFGEAAYFCSRCANGESEEGTENFCPSCGAKMRKR